MAHGKPQPTTGATDCSGFSRVIRVELDWSAPGNFLVDTVDHGGMGDNGALVASFTTPAAQGHNALLTIMVAEYPAAAPRVPRTLKISTSECDFTTPSLYGLTTQGSSATLRVSLGPNDYGFPEIQPNTRYHVNVCSQYKGQSSCPPGMSADVRLEIGKPKL